MQPSTEGASRLSAVLAVIHLNLEAPKQFVPQNTGKGENQSLQMPSQLSMYQKLWNTTQAMGQSEMLQYSIFCDKIYYGAMKKKHR